ncbi:MAG: FAD-dependent oxidoreductase [Burkholderiaceae bacterium]
MSERGQALIRWSVAGALVALAGLGWWLFGESAFDLSTLRDVRDTMAHRVRQTPELAALAFIAAYLLVAALALPGALVLTLLGGALFGFGPGVLLVALASSLGALLSFSVVRWIAGRSLRDRLAARLTPIASGIERDGAYYLFTLRVVPVFPFFLVNVLVALTPIRTWTFYWVSLIGMLPATLVYVNAGHQLASLDSLSGLLTPGLMGALALLGVFPLVARRLLPGIARRIGWLMGTVRANRRWRGQRPHRFDRDLIVIGAGAAGLVAANIAASLRAKVTLIEREAMGGDCLNTGCVPSKALIRLANRVREERLFAEQGTGIAGIPSGNTARPDLAVILDRVRATIDRIAPHDSVERYRALGVECIRAEARVLSPWTVDVTPAEGGGGERLHARHLIIATGAEPVVPDIAGLAPGRALTTQTLWAIRELPNRLLVLGGGPVGCELAQAFQRLGSAVTLVERAGRLLPREEPEASAEVRRSLEADGVRVLTGATLQSVQDGSRAHVVGAHGQAVIEFDQLLCALGRRSRVEGVGLDELGLARDADGTLRVDDWMRTSEPGVFACGDVATADRLTHVAGQMAWHAAFNALFGGLWPLRIDRRAIPRCVFTDPEVARVGLTRVEAEQAGIKVVCTRHEMSALDRAIIEEQTGGFVMVLTAQGSDRIVGATVVGARAGELISLFTLAIRERLGLRRLMSMMIAYPGWADAGRAVASQWQRDHAPVFVLTWLERWHRWRRR